MLLLSPIMAAKQMKENPIAEKYIQWPSLNLSKIALFAWQTFYLFFLNLQISKFIMSLHIVYSGKDIFLKIS